ncbi:MAG: response regulator [Gammaproteobacteria bacterium]|nr:response regulator [Gammaproteobacteria bacterium]
MWRILVVEDSRTNMMLTVEVLKNAGHIPLEAVTASASFDIARRDRPDAILMDIQLPDMSGIEAARVLKSDPATSHIPIIALTALAMKGDAERMQGAGFDGYISKPFRYKKFLAEMTDVIQHHRGNGD